QIAWNNVVATPHGYFHSPRMFDDPDDDQDAISNCPAIDLGNDNVFPYELDQGQDNQFVCDITTFFDPKPNTVGTDPTTGGTGKTDRKSTRLNSSHRTISYAVFCLKKKKKKKQSTKTTKTVYNKTYQT